MIRFITLIQAVTLISCSHAERESGSFEWQALQDAGSVDCASWPLEEQDMQLDELSLLGFDQPGYLAKVRRRDTTEINYYAPFSGRAAIDRKKSSALEIGVGSTVVGGLTVGSQSLMAFVTSGRQPRLELRRVPENTVAYFSSPFGKNIRDGRVVADRDGLWLAYRAGEDEYSVEDLPVQVAYFSYVRDPSAPMPMRGFRNLASTPYMQVLGNGKDSEVLTIDQATHAGRPQFKIRRLKVDGHASQALPIELPITGPLESWAATMFNNRVLLAYVDGDSLVGQANLKVAQITWNELVPSVDWVKTKSLLNQHVSEPSWVVRGDHALVLIPKWVDEESSIAAYKVTGNQVESLSLSGVFAKGTRVMEAFAPSQQRQVYTILRSRARYGWDFKICKLSTL